jgi:hypothetical protein
MARKRAAKEETTEQPEAATEPAPQEAGAKINKADAVRAAIAEGVDMPEEGVAYILKKFGIEVTKSQFSTYKSLDKKRDGATDKKKPGRKPTQPAPAAVAPTPKPSSNGSSGLAIQVEAIKTLVDTLGVDQVVSIARLFAK